MSKFEIEEIIRLTRKAGRDCLADEIVQNKKLETLEEVARVTSAIIIFAKGMRENEESEKLLLRWLSEAERVMDWKDEKGENDFYKKRVMKTVFESLYHSSPTVHIAVAKVLVKALSEHYIWIERFKFHKRAD